MLEPSLAVFLKFGLRSDRVADSQHIIKNVEMLTKKCFLKVSRKVT